MLPLVSINGTITTPEQQQISPLDRGFTLGDGIFETLRVTNGAPWYLGRHLERMKHGADVLGIPFPEHIQDWIGDVVHQTQTSGIHEFALRITLTRGPAPTAGLALSNATTPTTTIVAYNIPNFGTALYETGISVRIASARRNDRGFATHIKTTSYAEAILALREAKDSGFDDAVFLNTYDFVAEASASNVFVCLNNVVVTPASTQGILPGITRAVVLQLAQQAGFAVAEREVHDEELRNADEAFLTSSLRGIVPVIRVGENKLGQGTPGLITRQLMQAYSSSSSRI